eukprot:ctg_757.g355
MEEVRERSAVTVADGWRAPSPPAVATASAAPVGGDRWVREGSEPREASMWSNELVGNGGRNMEALARMSSGVMPAWDTQWAPGARPMSPYAPGATTGGDKPPAPSETPTAPAGAASSAAYPATPSPADMAALRAMMRRVYIIRAAHGGAPHLVVCGAADVHPVLCHVALVRGDVPSEFGDAGAAKQLQLVCGGLSVRVLCAQRHLVDRPRGRASAR